MYQAVIGVGYGVKPNGDAISKTVLIFSKLPDLGTRVAQTPAGTASHRLAFRTRVRRFGQLRCAAPAGRVSPLHHRGQRGRPGSFAVCTATTRRLNSTSWRNWPDSSWRRGRRSGPEPSSPPNPGPTYPSTEFSRPCQSSDARRDAASRGAPTPDREGRTAGQMAIGGRNPSKSGIRKCPPISRCLTSVCPHRRGYGPPRCPAGATAGRLT
jgi:hypothetical protein